MTRPLSPRATWLWLILTVLLGASLPGLGSAQDFDYVIRGGRVLDGSGNPAFNADVGVRGDEIVRVGDLSAASAGRVIDATGLYVVPGFIDLHSHADRAFASSDVEGRKAHNLVAQQPIAHQRLIHTAALALLHPQPARRVRLRVEVQQQHTLTLMRQTRREVDDRGRLPNPSLLVGHGND